MEIGQKLIKTQRRIGLTGGIASGKTTISKYIKTKIKIPILDADILSKELIKPETYAYEQILAYFGNQIIDKHSSKQVINRKLLRNIIFEEKEHREWIQKLLHPLIREKMIEGCNHYKKNKVILLVIPLLFEAKFTDICTEIWLVKCPEEIQIKRIIERDKISKKEALKIINSQVKYDEKTKLSDIILDNSNNLKQWQKKIKELF